MKQKLFKEISNPSEFYDNISGFYDRMIDFNKNLELRIGAYKNIFPTRGLVADIGCGIGLDSIALAKNGHSVIAFDISSRMVEEAKKNAKKYEVDFEVQQYSFDDIPREYYKQFDYIISVGNTIAHLNSKQLTKGLKKIFAMLKTGGILFLHTLNYELIYRQSKRINNIAFKDEQTIIRFYDLDKDKIVFNILSFYLNNPKNHQLVSTRHYPYSSNSLKKMLGQAGFHGIKFYADFSKNHFIRQASKDIFVYAVK